MNAEVTLWAAYGSTPKIRGKARVDARRKVRRCHDASTSADTDLLVEADTDSLGGAFLSSISSLFGDMVDQGSQNTAVLVGLLMVVYLVR